MTVEQFVATRRDRWRRLETFCATLDQGGPGALQPEDLAAFGDLYRQTSSDLAYAVSHLRQPDLSAYLNRLVAQAHSQLYAGSRARRGRLAGLVAGYPRRWRAAWPQLAISGGALVVAILVAWLLVGLDPRQAALFVPTEIRETLEFEQLGEVGVPSGALLALSSFILTNNLTAGLVAFAGGLLFGLGSLLAMLRNGFLIGALAGLAQAASPRAAAEFWALVLPHGVLELAALVTCGAAGLKLGWAVLAGGRQPRLAALRQASGEAFGLLLGALAWFLLAALIEGLVTPLPAPLAVKYLFATGSAVVLGWYLAGGAGPGGEAADQ